MSILKSILFYYNLAFILILLGIGFWTGTIYQQPALLIIIIPLILYFLGFLILKLSKNSHQKNQFSWILIGLLLIFNLFSTTVLSLFNLYSVRSLKELIISLLYLPFPVYFFLTLLHWSKKILQNHNALKAKTVSQEIVGKPITAKKIDVDRRRFLKLVGGTSVSVLLLTLINPKQAGAAFFGSVPGPGTVSLKDASGTKINPAEKQPTDGYKISQVDDDDYPCYYGYVNQSGAWYIMKEDEDNNYRYASGSSSFSANWALRSTLVYDYFDSVF